MKEFKQIGCLMSGILFLMVILAMFTFYSNVTGFLKEASSIFLAGSVIIIPAILSTTGIIILFYFFVLFITSKIFEIKFWSKSRLILFALVIGFIFWMIQAGILFYFLKQFIR